MLVFLDESYEVDGSGGVRHAYAGFGVDERNYRGLAAATFQAKLKYFKSAGSMSAEEIKVARKTHIVTAELPERAEVKALKLLTDKSARHHLEYGDAPGMLMAHALLDALRAADARVFGALSYPSDVRDIQDLAKKLPVQLVRILERIEKWMQEEHNSGAAIVVPDTVHRGIDLHLSQLMSDFLFRSADGQKMRHIVINPFWVDSSTTAGSQIADIIAHVLMNGMRRPRDRKPLDDLWKKVVALEFRSADQVTRGIRKVRTVSA